MAESYIKIKASYNELKKEFDESKDPYFYIKYFDADKNYNGDDNEKIVCEALIRHNEIGNRSVERSAPYTLSSLKKTMEKYVKEYEIDCVTNKNFLHEPVKNYKYFISENEYYNIDKKVENGYKVSKEDEYFYILIYGWQGYYYKDYEAFKNGDDVCYIPEYNSVNNAGHIPEYNCVNDNEKYMIISEKIESDDKYYRKDIINEVKTELCGKSYKDFFNDYVPENLINHIAEIVFDTIDWQHPSSYLYETEWDDTIKEYFVNYPDEIEKYASENLKKEVLDIINKKYKIGVKESYYTVFEVDGYSYENAINKLEDDINEGKIILDNTSSYQRDYVNDNSKLLDECFDIKLTYFPDDNRVLIYNSKNRAEYTCFTAADIIKSFEYFCNSFIEDHEITEENLKESEMNYE